MHVPLSCASLLIFVASITFAQQSPNPSSSMSDREKAGLRGPVKEEIDSQTMPLPSGEKVFTTTTRYTVDGRILENRATNPDGSEWVTSYSYYPDGRLLKIGTENAGSTNRSETTYLYDEQRRLVAIKSGGQIQTRYQYDDTGRKSATETLDSKPLPPNTAYAPHWEGTDLGFMPSPGGKITTMYNENGIATGTQFYDAEGNLIGHIVRKFDTEGRVVAEEQAADAPQQNLPEGLRSKLNAEQMKSVGTLMAGAQNTVISYSYDAEGRVTERHRSGGLFGQQVTVTTYNDHHDKASELETTVMSPDTGPWRLTDAGAFIPEGKQNAAQPPMTSETQYMYQYDQYGNWIEQTILSRSQPGEPFRPSTVMRRKLTYY